jgi:Protein of unknown function (DUF3631)
MKPHEYVAVALWALHTLVFEQFGVTPRLALVSPVRGCGKTVLLDVLQCLVPRPHKTDHASAAGIYFLAHARDTLLIDEADNLGLADNQALRAVLNSGHRKGGRVTRFQKRYSTFTPMAIAAIGSLPLPTMHRSVVIPMTRATRKLRRYDESDLQDLHIAYSMSRDWARSVRLNPDPELPEVLRNRPADNWRPLISIADTFGPAWGDRAREAAIEFSKGYHDEDMPVLLLQDIRKVFEKFPTTLTYFPSSLLVASLHAFEDAPWSEWSGVQGNQSPRKLSQGELAKLLRPFRIRPKSIWWPDRATGTSKKGYYRSDFEHAWRSFCDEAGTTAQPTNVRHLHSARGGRHD